MGDVTLSLLDGKHRVAETVFGWNPSTVAVGINEIQKLLADIHARMEPHRESESSLRTTLLYSNMTAKAVYQALVEKGWAVASLPTVCTISNILNRQGYRLRTAAKTQVQKKQQKPTRSLKMSGD